jgi:putative hemolysin
MALISPQDFARAAGISSYPKLALWLMKLMKIDAFNMMMSEAGNLEGVGFSQFVLDFLGISFRIDKSQLGNIPESGPFIVVCNHPYGGIESLALLILLLSQRPDTLFMGNFLLKKVPNLADYIIAVNPFEQIKDSSSITGLKTTLSKLKSGVPVAIFPAGEVSAYDFNRFRITDRDWHPVVGKLITKAGVPVIPIYFHGNNGLRFGLLRYIHPGLQTAMLPAQLFNKRGKELRVCIGKAVPPPGAAANSGETLNRLTDLRKITYALAGD